jgi:hypothetical protein
MSKQTAVEWLIEQLEQKGDMRETPSIRNLQLNIDTSDYLDLKKQAKQMEKEQTIDFYVKGCDDTYGVDYNEEDPEFDRKEGERLYNKTYGGDNDSNSKR